MSRQRAKNYCVKPSLARLVMTVANHQPNTYSKGWILQKSFSKITVSLKDTSTLLAYFQKTGLSQDYSAVFSQLVSYSNAFGWFLSKWVYKFLPSQKLVYLSGYFKHHIGGGQLPKNRCEILQSLAELFLAPSWTFLGSI